MVLDIVINHAARVFDYNYQNQVEDSFSDESIMDGPLGDEPPVQWLNGFGMPRGDWQDTIPDSDALSPMMPSGRQTFTSTKIFLEEGVTNSLIQRSRLGLPGATLAPCGNWYSSTMPASPEQRAIRLQYGVTPVVNILIKAYTQLIAKFDFDGFRIDTVKYVAPAMVQTFGNAIREFCPEYRQEKFFYVWGNL